MEFLSFLFKIMLSLALGGLIGIDRERSKKGFPAGIRTLAFISLLGMLSAFLSSELNNYLIMIVMLSTIFALLVVGYGVSFNTKRFFGFTSTIIIFLTFVIGMISYYDNYNYNYYAIALAIITTLILSQKTFLHSMVSKLSDNEIFDSLKFAIIAFIILPLIPNKAIDPWGIINPYELWFLVVLILSISYLGYFISKVIGKNRGIYLSGLVGGLISSTAVASSLSILSKKNESLSNASCIGIMLASSIMYIRILIEALIINFSFGTALLLPLILCALIGLSISLFDIRKNRASSTSNNAQIITESPFNLLPAIKFTLFIAVILIASRFLNNTFGESGIYFASMLAGLIDTDAITLSLASLVNSSLSIQIGIVAIIIAVLTNSIIKLLFVKTQGSKNLFKKMIPRYIISSVPLILFVLFYLIA
jgi:uncharacterized membrane protein (DUF4010 family)